jgi:hypothetical protein
MSAWPGWRSRAGRRLAYAVGFTMTDLVQDVIGKVPAGMDVGL